MRDHFWDVLQLLHVIDLYLFTACFTCLLVMMAFVCRKWTLLSMRFMMSQRRTSTRWNCWYSITAPQCVKSSWHILCVRRSVLIIGAPRLYMMDGILFFTLLGMFMRVTSWGKLRKWISEPPWLNDVEDPPNRLRYGCKGWEKRCLICVRKERMVVEWKIV